VKAFNVLFFGLANLPHMFDLDRFLGEVDALIDVVARIAEPVRDAILPTRNTQT
jgi:hypothetical protein